MSTLLIDNLLARGRIAPFAGNMFDVAIFGRDQSTRSEALEFERAHLRCSAITIGSPELRFSDRHPLTKQQLINGVQFIDTVSITWLEDQALSVWNYHRTWMSYFYDREKDQFRSGVTGKKRIAEVFLQEMKDIRSPEEANSRIARDNTLQHFLVLEGLMPTKLPELSLGWDKDDSGYTQIQITYRLDNLRYQIPTGPGLSTSLEGQFRSRPGGTRPNTPEGVEV